MKKRGLSVFLALVLFLSLLPATALADDGIAINAANFPDPVFRLYVSESIDGGDGVLTRDECEYVNWISVSSSNISTLKGIEYFTGLKYLYCSGNNLTSLDLSKNTKLDTLVCDYNKLTSLDISKNTNLYYLNCENNNLTLLNISNNTALTELDCSSNKLTALNISNNTSLIHLNCADNPIDKLDIRNNQKLLNAVTLGTKRYSWNEYDSLEYSISALDYSLYISRTTRLQTGSTEPPAVTAQPKSVSVAVGKKVTFSVTAQGSGLTYQWYTYSRETGWEWKAVNGATGKELTVTVKDTMYGAGYFCEITNSGGSVCTKEAEITIVSKPVILSQPSSKTVKAGKTVTFKVKAGGGSLKYQWYYQKKGTSKWVKIKNATKASYSFKAKKKLNGYKYRCTVSNGAGKVNSRAAKLTVK